MQSNCETTRQRRQKLRFAFFTTLQTTLYTPNFYTKGFSSLPQFFLFLGLQPAQMNQKRLLMWQKIKTYFIAHFFGFIIMVIGWALSINFIALDRGSFRFAPGGVTERSLFQTPTFIGLGLIIIGAYFPEIWIAIKNRKNKSQP